MSLLSRTGATRDRPEVVVLNVPRQKDEETRAASFFVWCRLLH